MEKIWLKDLGTHQYLKVRNRGELDKICIKWNSLGYLVADSVITRFDWGWKYLSPWDPKGKLSIHSTPGPGTTLTIDSLKDFDAPTNTRILLEDFNETHYVLVKTEKEYDKALEILSKRFPAFRTNNVSMKHKLDEGGVVFYLWGDRGPTLHTLETAKRYREFNGLVSLLSIDDIIETESISSEDEDKAEVTKLHNNNKNLPYTTESKYIKDIGRDELVLTTNSTEYAKVINQFKEDHPGKVKRLSYSGKSNVLIGYNTDFEFISDWGNNAIPMEPRVRKVYTLDKILDFKNIPQTTEKEDLLQKYLSSKYSNEGGYVMLRGSNNNPLLLRNTLEESKYNIKPIKTIHKPTKHKISKSRYKLN